MKKEVEGVMVEEGSGIKDWKEDYTVSDMQAAYERAKPRSWDDLLGWIKNEAEADRRITAAETVALYKDVKKLKDSGIPFTADPNAAFQQAHKYHA